MRPPIPLLGNQIAAANFTSIFLCHIGALAPLAWLMVQGNRPQQRRTIGRLRSRLLSGSCLVLAMHLEGGR